MSQILAGIGEVPEELKHIPTCSPSRLYKFMESPKKYKHVYIDGNKEETDAMLEGRMVHMYQLERHLFDKTYVNPFETVKPLKTVEDLKGWLTSQKVDFKGCKKKEDYEQACLFTDPTAPVYSHVLNQVEKAGQIIVTPEELSMLAEINREAGEHAWLGKAMVGGTYEQLMWFYDDFTEMVWRCKPDYFHEALGKHKIPACIDWKKMPDIAPDAFNAWLFKSKAFVQMAIYKEALLKIFGVEASIVIAAYDTKAPYGVEAYEVDRGAVDAGMAVFKKKGLEFAQCHKENKWPTHGRGKLLSGTLPSWAFNRIQFDEDQALEA